MLSCAAPPGPCSPNIAGPGFESLRRLTTLKDVLLEGNEQLTLTSQWMHGLQLRELEAHSCGVDGPVVEAISRMSELRTLNISECHGVSARRGGWRAWGLTGR